MQNDPLVPWWCPEGLVSSRRCHKKRLRISAYLPSSWTREWRSSCLRHGEKAHRRPRWNSTFSRAAATEFRTPYEIHLCCPVWYRGWESRLHSPMRRWHSSLVRSSCPVCRCRFFSPLRKLESRSNRWVRQRPKANNIGDRVSSSDFVTDSLMVVYLLFRV